MPILTKDAYPNYGMVTGGGGTMWDNHQTESFKKPRSFPFTYTLTDQILLDVQQLLRPVKSAIR